MQLYLIRHGETDWNRAKRFQSISDVPLNATGRDQAERIRRRFALDEVVFARALSSPLARARETAAIVLRGTGTSLTVDARLTEISLGDYEGKQEAELLRRHGAGFERWRDGCFTRGAPGGESIFQGMERADGVLASLAGCAPADKVLIVGHQGINMAIMAAISGCTGARALARFKQRNDEVEVWDPEAGRRLCRFAV